FGDEGCGHAPIVSHPVIGPPRRGPHPRTTVRAGWMSRTHVSTTRGAPVRYFTSDTHYGHANIIRYCGRPYDDTEQMAADLVARARAALGDHRDLWHLGDVAMGRIDDTLPNLARIGADV